MANTDKTITCAKNVSWPNSGHLGYIAQACHNRGSNLSTFRDSANSWTSSTWKWHLKSDKEQETHVEEVGMCLQLSQLCKGMIKTPVLPRRICFSTSSSIIYLKTWFVAKQRLVCGGHPLLLTPLQLGCYHACQKSTHCFANGWLFETLTINILVSHISSCKRREAEALNLLWIQYLIRDISPEYPTTNRIIDERISAGIKQR